MAGAFFDDPSEMKDSEIDKSRAAIGLKLETQEAVSAAEEFVKSNQGYKIADLPTVTAL